MRKTSAGGLIRSIAGALVIPWRKRTAAKYGFDVFAVASGSPEEAQLVEFFQTVNVKWRRQFQLPLALKKGIVKVMP